MTHAAWRPAHRGMKMYAERRRATTRVAPTTWIVGGLFSVGIAHVGVSPTPPIMKMGLASSSSRGRCRGLDSGLRRNDGVGVAGVLKGGFETRPYECRLVGGYFLRKRSCRLPPARRNMKMVGVIRESPLREVGQGLFSEEAGRDRPDRAWRESSWRPRSVGPVRPWMGRESPRLFAPCASLYRYLVQ